MTVLLGCLMVVGAAGVAALPRADDDYCTTNPSSLSLPEGSTIETSVSFWPPGLGCSYGLPDGTTETDDPSFIAFGAVLVGELLLLLAISRSPRSPPLTVAGLAAAAIGIAGLGALVGLGLIVPLGLGIAVGMPHTYVVDQRGKRRQASIAVRDAVLVGASVVIAFSAILAGLAVVVAWLLAITIAALLATMAERGHPPSQARHVHHENTEGSG